MIICCLQDDQGKSGSLELLLTGPAAIWMLDLSFLPAGQYSMEIFQDGINADRYAGDYKHLTKIVNSGDKMNIHLAPGGGWVGRIVPKQ